MLVGLILCLLEVAKAEILDVCVVVDSVAEIRRSS